MLNQLVNKEKKHLFKKLYNYRLFIYCLFLRNPSWLWQSNIGKLINQMGLTKHGLIINFFKKNTILTYGKYFPYVCTGKLWQFSVKHLKSNHSILLEVNYQVHLFKAAFCLAFWRFTDQ